jgi:hypothetical protein
MQATGELIRLLTYVDDIAATLRRITSTNPNTYAGGAQALGRVHAQVRSKFCSRPRRSRKREFDVASAWPTSSAQRARGRTCFRPLDPRSRCCGLANRPMSIT